MKSPRWLRPRPDSLIAYLSHGGRRSASLWIPGIHLVWLAWMFGAPWVFKKPGALVWWATYGSIAIFLVLYHQAWLGSRARLPACTLAIALLGLAIVPVNSSWSYIIYAGSFVPFFARGWRVFAWVALLCAAFFVVAMASGFFTPLTTLGGVFTTLLVAVLNLVYRYNAERDVELRLSQDEVRRLAIASERERIGRDLHDLLGHTLSLVVIKSSLARRLVDDDPVAAARELDDIERVARQSLAEVREAVTGMRAVALAGELAAARLLLEADDVALHFVASEIALAPDVEAALAMSLREAVTNVQRHARATRVEVRLDHDAGGAELTVRDDGRGGASLDGNGLTGIRERLARIGGSLVLESLPGAGTLVTMRVPPNAGPT